MFDFDKPFPCYVQKKWEPYSERVKIRSLFRLSLRVLLRTHPLTFFADLHKSIGRLCQTAIEEVYLMNDEELAKQVLDTLKPRHISLSRSSLPPLEHDDYGLLRILAFLSCTMNDRSVIPPVSERLLSLDLRGQSLPFIAYRYILSAAELTYEKLLRTLITRRLLYLEWMLSEGLLEGVADFEDIAEQTPSAALLDTIRQQSGRWIQCRWNVLRQALEFLPECDLANANVSRKVVPTQSVSDARTMLSLEGITLADKSRERYSFRYYPRMEENILRNSERVLACMVLDEADSCEVFLNMPTLELSTILCMVNSHLLASLVAFELELIDNGQPSNVHLSADISIDSSMMRGQCGDFGALVAVVRRQYYIAHFPYEVGLLKLSFGGVKISELREHATYTMLASLVHLETPPYKEPCLERLSLDSDFLFSFGNTLRFRHLKAICLKIPPGNAHPLMISRLAAMLSESPSLTRVCLHGFNLRNKLQNVFDRFGKRRLSHVALNNCRLEDSDFEFLHSAELFSNLNALAICDARTPVLHRIIPVLGAFGDSLECLTVKDYGTDPRLVADALCQFGEIVLQLKRLRLLRAHFSTSVGPTVLLPFLKQVGSHGSLVDVEVNEPFRAPADSSELFSSRCKFDSSVCETMEEEGKRWARYPVQVFFKREIPHLHWTDYEPIGDVWLPPIPNIHD